MFRADNVWMRIGLMDILIVVMRDSRLVTYRRLFV